MSLAHQPSMWDLAEEATLGPLAVTRHQLSDGAWVDHLPGWVQGSDQVLEVLLGDIGWREDRRQMYEREVAVPRLDRKSTRLNSSHANISYAVFCLKQKQVTAKCESPS